MSEKDSEEELLCRIRLLEGQLLAAKMTIHSVQSASPAPASPGNELDILRMRMTAIENSRSWRLMTRLQRVVNLLRGWRIKVFQHIPLMPTARPPTGHARFSDPSALEAWIDLMNRQEVSS
ncbi:MAG: hypothetical protein ABNH49_10955 [Hyphomonas sp.]